MPYKSVLTPHERMECLTQPEMNTGCLLWSGAIDRKGYGKFWYDGKSDKAHRVSWSMAFGAIPNGLCVLHRCDTPACVNEGHLFLGTLGDNSKDMRTKGRVRRGVRQFAPFSAEDANKVHDMRASGMLQREIGAALGIDRSTVSRILSGERWAWPDSSRGATRS